MRLKIKTALWLGLVCIGLWGCAAPAVPEVATETTNATNIDMESAYPEPAAYPAPLAQQPQTAYPEPDTGSEPSMVTQLQVAVVASYPHQQAVFTQGLVWADGFFYESGGLYGRSALYRVGVDDGEPVQQVVLDETLFAEGLALVDGRLILLTWKGGTALVFDRETLTEVGRFEYTGEGWGLCYDESRSELWMSDGSDRLVRRDPTTFEAIGELRVTRNGAPVTQINELECVDGIIYANLWKFDQIVGIDADTGVVEFEVDASTLLSAEERAQLQTGHEVLNGIAYNGETGRFFLTGKHWPKLFEVEFR